MYGFEGEVKAKYSGLMMNLFSEVFNWLPLAHCIEGKILVGGWGSGCGLVRWGGYRGKELEIKKDC